MLKKPFVRAAHILALSTFALSAHANVFSFEYNDTVSASEIAGVFTGDTAKITVNLDNGGTSPDSQTWTANDLQAITFNFNNGALLTTFSDPFGGDGLDGTFGNFVTDVGGALTSVMGVWVDGDYSSVGTDFTTNGTTPFAWYINGLNGVYFGVGSKGDYSTIKLTNVGNDINPAFWASSSAVPVPATLWLLAPGLAGLGMVRKRRT